MAKQLLNAATASLGMTPTGVQHIRAAYSIREAAHLCSVSPWWIRMAYYDGRIKGLKAGPKLLIPASEIDKLLKSMETPYEPATDGIGAAQRARAVERRKAKAAPRQTVNRKHAPKVGAAVQPHSQQRPTVAEINKRNASFYGEQHGK